jgi:cob(I)alamin adenosyltransferase
MKIYTGTGDRGKTSLFSGERIAKSDDRIEAYGDVDELSSVIGVLISLLPKELEHIQAELRQIQSDLFHMGAWLSTMPDSASTKQLKTITTEPLKRLENSIDQMDADLPTIKSFILPGGHVTASVSHLARTVCRRTERHVIRLHKEKDIDDDVIDQIQKIIIYLNRLSDYLFVFARYLNATFKISDIPWKS